MATVDVSKIERAAQLIAEAAQLGERLDALRAELPKATCTDCGWLMFQYRTPIAYVLHKCRGCGSWNEITAP